MKILKELFNRKIINDPKLQYGVAGFFVILGLTNFIFFFTILKVIEIKFIEMINYLDVDSRKFILEMLKETYPFILTITFAFGIFVIIFSFLGGILLLQLISGPAYVMKQFLNDILEQKKTRYPLKLRKYDFFNEQIELLNKVYEKYFKNSD